MQEFATRKAIAHRMDLRLLNCLLRKYRMAVRIMKLTIILLAACLQLSARGLTQTVTISVKDAPLLTVLKAIKKQTGFVFFISSSEIKIAKNVSITANKLPLQQVLDMCFKDQPLTYTITGKWINITPRIQQTDKINDKTSFKAPLPQNKEINGIITDENGSPAPGVNVTEKGTGKGTSTNYKGEFQLKDVNENAYLVITSVGYDKMEVSVKGKSFLSVQLKIAVGNLDELQVIGYGTTSKRFSTGNINTIKSSDIEQQPVQNPLLALQGRVPGVEVTQLTGMPGGGVTVRIQGNNSIGSLTGNTGIEPLIVIDGVPFSSQLQNSTIEGVVQGGSPLNYINPQDIESIDVLKDADATAIYGSRAANGAILITTKKGKAGKTKFNLNLQQGWAKVGHFADMMDTRQYLDMRYQAFKNDGIASIPSDQYDLTLWDTTRYTDWQKTLIGGTAKYTNVNASVSGGNSQIQYLIGGTYNRQTTVFPGDFDDKKASIHFNLNGTSSNQRFKISFSGNYMYDNDHLLGTDLTQNALLLAPDAPALYNDNGTLNWAPNASGSSTWNNPLIYTLYNEYNNTTKNLVSNLNLSYKVFSGLEIRSNFGYSNIQSQLYLPSRLETNRPEDRPTSYRFTTNGERDMTIWIIEPQAQYTSKIGEGQLNGLIGTTIQQGKADVLVVGGSGYSSDLLMKTLTAATSLTAGLASSTQTKFNALFGRLNYIWDRKYLLNLTARRDGSSKFGDANKLHNFGGVGLGWVFSEEKWLQRNLSFLSFGKLRTSYGTTGNDQIGDFQNLSLYGIRAQGGIDYQGTSVLRPISIPNPYLQWEVTKKWQSGIDLGVLKDRIMLSATYARNRSSNQLIKYVIPSTTGFTTISKNLPALVQNTSWEFTLNTTNLNTKAIQWSTSFNLTIPRNKLVSFPGIENTSYASGNNGVVVGQPLGVVSVYQYAGVDPATGKYLVFNKDGSTTSAPVIGTANKYPVAPMTKLYGGMQNTLSYKGFQLAFNFQFVRQRSSNDLYYYNGYAGGAFPPGAFVSGGFSNQPISVLNSWHKTGEDVPIARYGTNIFGVVQWPSASDVLYTYDASFIRLKNLSFSWRLPKNWLHKAMLQSCLFYFRGENLLTFTNYLGLDPESRNLNSLPPLKMMTVGMQIEL